MTLQQRLSIARTLTIIQLVLSSVVLIAMFGFAAFAVSSFLVGQLDGVSGVGLPPMIILALAAVVMFAFGLAIVALPWIVLTALKKRNEKWAKAAFVSLIVQIVMAGGVFAIFPIVTIILLLDKEASAYIGMK
jgi:hypothetical protein